MTHATISARAKEKKLLLDLTVTGCIRMFVRDGYLNKSSMI